MLFPTRQVRGATVSDARPIAEVHVASWRVAYRGLMSDEYLDGLSIDHREASWRAYIARGAPEILVCEQAGLVEGWAAFGHSRDAGSAAATGEIWSLYAHPSYWSTGVGRALWVATHHRLWARGFNRVNLWVLTANPRALRFYRSLGLAPEPEQVKTFSMGGRTLEEIRYSGSLAAPAT